MAKITRKTQKILGGNSSNTGIFGNAQKGIYDQYSQDPDVIQTPEWESGWNQATFSGAKIPPLEERQAVDLVVTRQLAYLFQAGIPEWIATETYYEGSIARDATGVIYKSLQDNNLNHALTDGAWWGSAVTGGVPDGVYGDITVSGGGTVWTVNNNAITTAKISDKNVTFAKVQDVATRTIAGRTTAGSGSLEQLSFIDDDTFATATANNVASAESTAAYVLANRGSVIKRGYTETTSIVNCPTAIPQDDTIPQITEGDEVLSTSFAMTSASNRLRITVVVPLSATIGSNPVIALFNGSANAICAAYGDIRTTSVGEIMTILIEITPATTSSVTYSVRAGGSSTLYVNGRGATRVFGGVSRASMVLEEIIP